MADKFIVYVEELECLNDLSNEEVGILLRAIMGFVKTENEQDVPPTVSVAYKFIISHIRRDIAKYNEICEKRRAAGKKGGEAKSEAKKELLKQDVKNRLDSAHLQGYEY